MFEDLVGGVKSEEVVEIVTTSFGWEVKRKRFPVGTSLKLISAYAQQQIACDASVEVVKHKPGDPL